MAYAKNMFGGMDMDSSPRNRDGKKYFRLLNGEVISDEQLSSGAIRNMKGNLISHEFDSVEAGREGIDKQTNLIIIGAYSIGDYVIYYTTSNDNTEINEEDPTQGQIWRVRYNETSTPEEVVLIYHGKLNFYNKGYIYSTGRIINDKNIKVYFVDGYNTIRTINILDDDLINKEESYLDIIGDSNLSKATAAISNGGYYKAGSVQYSYQLINFNGVETTFAPMNQPYHISEDATDGSVGNGYKGTLSQASNEENTGKGFAITINDVDPDYAYIRVVALFYESYNSTPEIRIVAEEQLVGDTFSTFDDGSVNLGTYSANEFVTLGLLSISPKTITNVSDRLAVANVKKNQFDFDYDARAYRFASDKTSFIRNEANDVWYTIHSTTNNIIVRDRFYTEIGGFDAIPEDFDCISPDQDLWKYKNDYSGSAGTIGGLGPNIEYEFKLLPVTIDVIENKAGVLQTGSIDWSTMIPIDDGRKPVTTTGYIGYANEQIASQFRGYKRDEVYRFGIIGFNDKNQQSYVKWIADIKMPKVTDKNSSTTWIDNGIPRDTFDIAHTDTTNDNIEGLQLYLKFKVKNLPKVVKKFQIVREERTQKDRTVVAQGIVSPVIQNANLDHTPPATFVMPAPLQPIFQDASDATNVWSLMNASNYKLPTLALLYSPDISYNNMGNYNGSLNIIGDYNGNASKNLASPYEPDSGDHPGQETVKCYKFNKHLSYTNIPIQFSKIVDGSFTYQDINGVSKYRHFIDEKGPTGVTSIHARGGTALALRLDEYDGLYDSQILINDIAVNYAATDIDEKKSRVLVGEMKIDAPSQYGGKTYQKRQGRPYIEASDIIKTTDDINPIYDSNVFGGDTYVEMAEILKHYTPSNGEDHSYKFDGDYSSDENQTTLSVVRFPLESSINLAARAHKNYGSMSQPSRFAVSEKAGYHWLQYGSGIIIEYRQETGFYSYNSAYSKENNIKKYYSTPIYEDKISYNEENAIYISDSSTKLSVNDNWLRFLQDNSTNVNGTNGIISSIHDLKGKLVFVQDNGIGYLNIDSQTIIPTSEEELVLGNSNLFSKPLYITKNYGTRRQSSAVVSKQGLYVLDEIRKAIVFVNGQAVDISRLKGVNSYLKYVMQDEDVFGELVNEYKNSVSFHEHRIYFNVNGTNLIYNELMQAFECFTSKYNTFRSFTHKNKLIDISSSNMNKVWIDGIGQYGAYYVQPDNTRLTNLEFEFIVNEGDLVKIFDLIEYNMYPQLNNLDSIRIVENGNTTVAYDFDPKEKIRFKKIRANLPRVAKSSEQSNTIGKNRYMNNYAHIKLAFKNIDGQSFKLLDMITHYRVSSMPFN